jgi:type I restriction enzyme, S subunit
MTHTNNIKAGYKNTEVGVIPEDWEMRELGEVFTFYSTSNYSKAEMSLYGDVGCIHYGLIHAIENPHFSLSTGVKYYVTNAQAKYEAIKEGDVIMVDASEDLVGLNKSIEVSNLNNKEYIAGLHTFHLRDKNGTYVNTFRGLILNSNTVKSQMLRLAVGMKVFGVSKPQLQKVLIPIPTLAEQTAIATALSDADALISSLETLIAKKRDIKQGAMQQLLQPKEGWEVRRLGEVVINAQLGGNYSNSDSVSSFPLIKMGNIQRGYISTNKIEYLSIGSVPEKRDRLKFGDLLFNTRNTLELVGKVAIWRDELDEAYFNSNIMKFEFSHEFISTNFFMNYLFNAKSIISKLKDIATGTTSVAAIYTRDLMKIGITIPNRHEQTRIATILSDMDADIGLLETKLEKYRQVKLGMMQNLLTGKIRLV